MTSNVSCVLNVNEANPATSAAACNIEFHITYRYQLCIPSEEQGTIIVIEDVVTPELRTSLTVTPLVFPLSIWCEHHLSNALNTLNLDACVFDFLKPKITEFALSLARRNRSNGFAMVVELGIFKVEYMGKDEVDRIEQELIKMEPSSEIGKGQAN